MIQCSSEPKKRAARSPPLRLTAGRPSLADGRLKLAWIAERPADQRPERALAVAWELLEGQTDVANVKLELERFDVELDELARAELSGPGATCRREPTTRISRVMSADAALPPP